MIKDFPHRQSAHCETGVIANMLTYKGIETSEAMVFGIGSGLFFGFFPFMKLSFVKFTTYRHLPGNIFKRTMQRIGAESSVRYYKDEVQSMNDLDGMLARGIPVALQVNIQWLPFVSSYMRVPFNSHNLIVIGKEGDEYIISDPVIEKIERCPAHILRRCRFAKGKMSPKGKMYYISKVPKNVDFTKPAIEGIKTVCFNMLKVPLPLVGVRGIRYMANYLKKQPGKVKEDKFRHDLAQIVYLQEFVGTGGAGFRFMYAAFLKEAARVTGLAALDDASRDLTATGDMWRKFAEVASRLCKGRPASGESYALLPEMVMACADGEEKVYRMLRTATN